MGVDTPIKRKPVYAWHILWLNPVTQSYNTMIGRKIGDEIVQEYRDENGILNQWIFSEIAPKSFHWIGRSSNDSGKRWDAPSWAGEP